MATMTKAEFLRRKVAASKNNWTRRFNGMTFIPYGPFYLPKGVTECELQQMEKEFRDAGYYVRKVSEHLKNKYFGNTERVFLYLHPKGAKW